MRPSSLVLLIALALAPLGAEAQPSTRFAELARGAADAPNDLRGLATPLLADCTGLSPAAERGCISARRRRGASIARATWLLEVPGPGHVEVGPFEPASGGFRLRVPGFARMPSGDERGVVATRPLARGVLPEEPLAEGFVVVPWVEAPRWYEANPPSRLAVRYVFRFGADWTDRAATDPARAYGVALEVLGVQVYNEASGHVLLDTTHPSTVPPAPPRLDTRRPLWSRTTRAEARWTAPNGDGVVLHVRLEPLERSDGLTTIVMANRGASSRELARFVAPCCSAAVDARPHGRDGILLIITEIASSEGASGRGQVVLARWDERASGLAVVARWAGDNGATPPSWVLDPDATVPADATAPAAP